jgi:phytoene dehydrogenase-like protein
VSLSRREFLAASGAMAAAALVGCGRKAGRRVEGGFVDDGGARGHRLRDRAPRPAVRRTERVPVVIVGGGIAGLSAAWWLRRSGFRDFVLLEMEDQPGGNARWGESPVSAYPWAAHYVPVPGRETALVRELFVELGVLRDGVWDETVLVSAPEERTFRWGRWHEGFEGVVAETAAERAELRRFHERMEELRATGEFTIPSALGARPSALDGLSMRDWLRREGFRTPALHWYVDYACRDDYGALSGDTSAWAGVHYFASRAGEDAPLTWPEGNGWIVRRLLERLGGHVRTGAPVHRVESLGTGVRVLAGEVEYRADTVVWAAPSFVAAHVVEGAPRVDFTYSPWLTANLTLDRLPEERGPELAWDNVMVDSPSLGYVVANHQALAQHRERSVWTCYWALAHQPPREARQLLLRRSWKEWTEEVLADLERAHPDIRSCVSQVDIMRMGHAMVRPTPGFLSSPARRALAESAGPVFYAHSDLSGLSLFEEAQHLGVEAAERVLERVGGVRRTLVVS